MRSKKSILRISGIFVLVLMISGSAAFGQTTAKDPDGWMVTIVPYFWAVGIEGDITVKGRNADVDVSFDEIWDNLDIGLMGHLELQKGRWGGFFDFTYTELSSENQTSLGKIDTETSLTISELGAVFRAQEWPSPDMRKGPTALDIIGGGRFWDTTAKIRTPTGAAYEKTVDWVDPFIGLRMIAPITERAAFSLRGDLGGFGAGSDFTWNFVALFGYDFTRIFSAWVGYKALGLQYEEGEGLDRYKFDTVWHGPVIGLMFRF